MGLLVEPGAAARAPQLPDTRRSGNPVSSNQGNTRRPIKHREQKPVHINAAIFKKIYVYYGQVTQQAEVEEAQYVDDIEQLKTLERHFTRTGNIGYEQVASQNKNSQQDPKTLTRTCNNTMQGNGIIPQTNADTLEKLTRTRNPEQPENAYNTTKTRENPEQNRSQTAQNAHGIQAADHPIFGGITGVTAAQTTKNPPTDNVSETGSNKAFMVRQTGFEPATC